MSGKGSTFDNDLLKLIFNATPIANIADNASSSPLTNLWVSLHTADPGAGGNQQTNEAAYPSYARVSVARTSGGWTVTGVNVSPAADIAFPTAGTMSSPEIETFAAVGTASSGTGKILYRGPLNPTINVSTGVTPKVTAGSIITES